MALNIPTGDKTWLLFITASLGVTTIEHLHPHIRGRSNWFLGWLDPGTSDSQEA